MSPTVNDESHPAIAPGRDFLHRNAREVLLLGVFGFIAYTTFRAQMLGDAVGAPLQTFFGGLEFCLALVLGTLLQMILSREQFLREQKSSALSAYRRVLDIRRAIIRLKATLANMRLTSPQERRSDLDIVEAIADGLSDTADSSIGDWHDIIGEEMVAFNRIGTLISDLKSSPATDSRLGEEADQRSIRTEMRAEIDRLRSTLPPILQTALEFEEEFMPREGRISFSVLRHLQETVRQHGCIRVLVQGGSETPAVGADHAHFGGPFHYRLDHGAGQQWLIFSSGDASGLVVNPLQHIYEKDYYASLLAILPTRGDFEPYGQEPIEIVGSQFDGSGAEPGTFYVRIPMTEDEFLMAVRRLQLPMP